MIFGFTKDILVLSVTSLECGQIVEPESVAALQPEANNSHGHSASRSSFTLLRLSEDKPQVRITRTDDKLDCINSK